MKEKFFTIVFAFIFTIASAQYGYRDGNRIGITLGLTQTSLTTKNFDTKPGSGWVGGLSVRGNYYNDFSMIFGMQFSENNFSVATLSTPFSKKQDVTYTLASAQIRLLLSYNIVKDHVSLDFGPVLQVNGKLKIDSRFEDNSISGTTLKAKDIIEGISKGNPNGRLVFEHMVPKEKYIQRPCESIIRDNSLTIDQKAVKVYQLLDSYWYIASITAEEDKSIIHKRTMPLGWNGVSIFDRYKEVNIEVHRNDRWV